MRTTLNLDDRLIRGIKRRAAESGTTMTALIETALAQMLERERRPRRPFKLRWVAVRGRLQPGADLTDRDALYERMEERA